VFSDVNPGLMFEALRLKYATSKSNTNAASTTTTALTSAPHPQHDLHPPNLTLINITVGTQQREIDTCIIDNITFILCIKKGQTLSFIVSHILINWFSYFHEGFIN